MEAHERELLQKTHDAVILYGERLETVLDRLEDGDARFKIQEHRLSTVEMQCSTCETHRKSRAKIVNMGFAAMSVPMAASLWMATQRIIKWLQGP